MNMPQVISYGGGLDSWAMLLEAVRRGEQIDCVAFCDVAGGGLTAPSSQPGEWPSTYKHLREVVVPFCRKHGIRFEWIDGMRYPVRNATGLFQWLWDRFQIPMAGPRRICTIVAKVERFEAWLDDHYPGQDVRVWIGFEAGEERRAANDPNAGTNRKLAPGQARRQNRFPLIEWGLCRCRCEELARAARLPVPRKSACVFCPYASKGDWQTFQRELPRQFAQVVELERRKPPTERNGLKLSIMGYDSKRMHRMAAQGLKYTPPTLPEWTATPYRVQRQSCEVCGAVQRATKATGCSYLVEGRF